MRLYRNSSGHFFNLNDDVCFTLWWTQSYCCLSLHLVYLHLVYIIEGILLWRFLVCEPQKTGSCCIIKPDRIMMHRSVNVQTISGGKSNLFLKIREDKDTQVCDFMSVPLWSGRSLLISMECLPCTYKCHWHLVHSKLGAKVVLHIFAMQIPGGLVPIVPESC